MSIYRVVTLDSSKLIYKETVVVLLSLIFMQNFVVKNKSESWGLIAQLKDNE